MQHLESWNDMQMRSYFKNMQSHQGCLKVQGFYNTDRLIELNTHVLVLTPARLMPAT